MKGSSLMNKRKRDDDSSDEAFKDFRKNMYPLLYRHAYADQSDEDLMDYHICLACHPSGKLELGTTRSLPKYVYKSCASIKVNGQLSF